MITTKQVRAIIRKHNRDTGYRSMGIWTNKVGTGDARSVKIYACDSTPEMIAELQEAVGAKNVRLTNGVAGWGTRREEGLTVRCVIG